MNAFLLAALVAGSPSIQAQNAQRTFHWEPMPLPKLANKLAAVLGEPVQVAKTLWPTTVMVHAEQATVREVQDKIAEAINATWSKRGGVWYLEQTSAQARSDEQTYRQERIRSIQRLLDHNRKQLQAQKPFDEQHARRLYEEMRDFAKLYGPNDNERVSKRVNELEQESPVSRLNRRFLLALKAETLASVNPGERKIFSTNPTPMQSPMPGEVAKLIAQYVEEQNLWAQVTGGQPVVDGDGNGLGIEFGAFVEEVNQPVGTVLLSVEGYLDDTFGFKISVFDKSGKFMLEAESSSWDTLDESVFAEVNNDNSKVTEGLKLSPESDVLRNLLTVNNRKADRWKAVTDALLALWRKPTQRDPLGYYVGDLLSAEARNRKKSLVAVVPDQFIDQYEYGIISDIEGFLKRNPPIPWIYDALVEEDANWLVMKSTNPLRIRKSYHDRSLLEQEFAMGARLDPPSLEEEADLASKSNQVASPFTAMLYTLRANPFHSGNQLPHLRVFAAMTQPGRIAAARKGGVALSMLPKAVQTEVHKIVYNGEPYSIFIDEAESDTDGPPKTDADDQDSGDSNAGLPNPKMEAFWNGILREPTVCLPNGIPLNTTISFEVETSYWVQTGPEAKGLLPRQGDLLSPSDLAERVYMAANPKLFPWITDSTMNVNSSRMRLIVSRQIKITYNFQNGFRTIGSLQELRPVPNKTFTLSTLPAEIKEEFLNAQKELDTRMKNRRP